MTTPRHSDDTNDSPKRSESTHPWRQRIGALLAAAAGMVGVCVVLLHNVSAPPAAQTANERSTGPASEPLQAPPGASRGATTVFGQWGALGSGCRGRFDRPGDVTAGVLAPGGDADHHQIRFHLPSFALDTGAAAADPRETVRLSCAIHVAVQPPAGFALEVVEVHGGFSVAQAPAAHAQVYASASVGGDDFGVVQRTYPAGRGGTDTVEPIDLRGSVSAGSLPAVQCAEGHVVAIRLSWTASAGPHERVRLSMAGDRAATLGVRLRPCRPPAR